MKRVAALAAVLALVGGPATAQVEDDLKAVIASWTTGVWSIEHTASRDETENGEWISAEVKELAFERTGDFSAVGSIDGEPVFSVDLSSGDYVAAGYDADGAKGEESVSAITRLDVQGPDDWTMTIDFGASEGENGETVRAYGEAVMMRDAYTWTEYDVVDDGEREVYGFSLYYRAK